MGIKVMYARQDNQLSSVDARVKGDPVPTSGMDQWRDYIGVLNGSCQRNSGSSIAILPVIQSGTTPATAEETTACLNNDGNARGSSRSRRGSRNSQRSTPFCLEPMLKEKVVDCCTIAQGPAAARLPLASGSGSSSANVAKGDYIFHCRSQILGSIPQNSSKSSFHHSGFMRHKVPILV